MPAEGDDAPDRVVAFEARALGSALRLAVRLPRGNDGRDEEAAATRAWNRVLNEFDAVDRALSRFRDDSELTMLNRLAGTGAIVGVSRRLRVALATVDRASRVTGGRFDATVLETLERIGEHGAEFAAGTAPPVAVDPAERRWNVHVPEVPIDSGGIGKGLALRWAAEAALDPLPTGAGLLLDAGGDIVHAGEPPQGGWRIGVEDPAAETAPDAAPLVVMALASGAVATSSVGERNWIGPDGRPVHHLVDPRTREPARTGLIAVTVAGPDPAWAEVWTKALFIAGRDAIGDESRARGMAAWWVDDRGRLGMTPDARVRTLWAAEERLG
jgi:thiamine biosynthesis lipoprotein